MEIQTRSEENGIGYYTTLQAAFDAAKGDDTIWKISFGIETGERVRLVRGSNNYFFITKH